MYEDRVSTVSTTVHHTRNAVARGKSGIMPQHGHRSRSLCNRIYYGAGTAGPFTLARLLGLASDLDGHMRTSRALVPVKTAMEKEQVRERERSRRKTRCSGPFTRKKVPTPPPLDDGLGVSVEGTQPIRAKSRNPVPTDARSV